MPFVREPTVSNVKLSCSIDLLEGDRIVLNKDLKNTSHSNFTVVKKTYVYTIFKSRRNPKSYHVNITKIPCTEEIGPSIEELNSVITNDFVVTSYKVENLTYSLDVGYALPLMDIFELIKRESVDIVRKIRFNPERFPGMFVTLESGTVLVFSSGKMVIIGVNTAEKMRHGLNSILTLVQRYKPMQIETTA